MQPPLLEAPQETPIMIASQALREHFGNAREEVGCRPSMRIGNAFVGRVSCRPGPKMRCRRSERWFMSNLHVRVTGTAAELNGFLRSLKYLDSIRVVSTHEVGSPSGPLDDEPFGASEIVTLIIDIATGLGTAAAYDIMSQRFRDYREGRRHMRIERVDPAPDTTTDSDEEQAG